MRYSVANDLNLLNARAVHLEGSFDPYARSDASNGDRESESAAAKAHDRPLKHLDALSIPLDHLRRHLDGVAGLDRRQIALHLLVRDRSDQIHGFSVLAQQDPAGAKREDSTGGRTPPLLTLLGRRCPFKEVRAAGSRPLACLLTPPSRYSSVITREEDLRDRHPAVFGRARVLRVLKHVR